MTARSHGCTARTGRGRYRAPLALCLALAIGLPLAATLPAAAQAPQTGAPAGDGGFTRIQGRDAPGAAPAPLPSGELLLDLREEMRMFVIGIARFARRYKPDFRIVVRGGLDLLVKRDDVDENRVSPARTYARALDGLLAEGMFFTEARPGTPPPPERQAEMLQLAEHAQRSGVKVMTLDYGAGNQFVDQARAEAEKRNFISLVIDRPLLDMSELPAYPPRPFDENSGSVLSLTQVKNFIAVTNSLPFGREDAFALKLHDTNYDMVIVDVFHGRKPLSPQAVETLKYKKVGAKRLVLAQMDIGTAASYRYYWKDDWREGSPSFIGAPLRGDPDRYYVEYWQSGWKNIIAGDTSSYLYGIIRQGFDGVLLDGLEVFRYFEGGGEEGLEENQ